MSRLRPETRSTDNPALTGGSAYFAIFNAVKSQDGLIAGRLDDGRGAHCTIGSYFAQTNHMPLPMALIDEVAAINDSITGSPKVRKREMVRWLKWKLGTLGFPGYERYTAKK
jgi:hypothetical protein